MEILSLIFAGISCVAAVASFIFSLVCKNEVKKINNVKNNVKIKVKENKEKIVGIEQKIE